MYDSGSNTGHDSEKRIRVELISSQPLYSITTGSYLSLMVLTSSITTVKDFRKNGQNPVNSSMTTGKDPIMAHFEANFCRVK